MGLHVFLQDLIERGEKQPNITISILVSFVVIILTIFFRILFGGKKTVVCYLDLKACAFPKSNVILADPLQNKFLFSEILQVNVTEASRSDAAEPSNNQGSSGEKEDEGEKEDAAAPPRRRNTRRET